MTDTAGAIMDAAERRIRKAGYNGFSFREIADDVGIKSASVHYHFPTKEALAAAVARRYTERFLLAVDEHASRGGDAIDVWVTVFRRALKDDGRMCLCGSLGAASHDLPSAVLSEARRFFERGMANLVEGGLPESRAMHVMAILEGAMLLANVLADDDVFEKVVAGLHDRSA